MEEMLREFIGEFREYKVEMQEFRTVTKNSLDTLTSKLDSISTRIENLEQQENSVASQPDMEKELLEVKSTLKSILSKQKEQEQVIKLLSYRSIELEAMIQVQSRISQD